MSKKRGKTIFISDLHLGDKRCMGGNTSHRHPYGLLLANIPLVTEFLASQLDSEDVDEIIILGDLFDGWTIPADTDPTLNTYWEDICQTEKNRGIFDNLRSLAAHPEIKLSYLPGNHDMTVPKECMEELFPGINCISTATPGWYVFHDGQLAAEHGHMYSLLNAPNDWLPKPFPMPLSLPLGYYFARIVAYKVARTGKQEEFFDTLFKFIEAILESNLNILLDVFLAIAEDAELDKDSPIDMDDGQSASVEQVIDAYSNIFREWAAHTPTQTTALEGLWGDLLLAQRVHERYFLHDSDTKIVICGHTHVPALKAPFFAKEEAELQRFLKIAQMPVSHIYANCGTWIDSAPRCTYVETCEDVEHNRHYVRLKSYSKDGSHLMGVLSVRLDESAT